MPPDRQNGQQNQKMIHITLVVISIVLLSYVLTAGLSYTNLDYFSVKEKNLVWVHTNLDFADSWVRYQTLTNRAPTSADELLSLGAKAPQGFLLTSLAPTFPGWCFSGKLSQAEYSSLQGVATRFPGQYGVSDHCGYTNGPDPSWMAKYEAGETLDVIVTYRLSR